MNNLEIIKANPQGFCQGVIRAMRITKKALSDKDTKRPIYILGSIVHNKNITNAFKCLGLIEIKEDDLKNISEGTIIFTAHGISPKIKKLVVDKGLSIVDATCPMVEKIHNIVSEKSQEGYQIAFLGKANHEETKGILDISSNVTLVKDDLTIENPQSKCLLVCQTTLSFPKVLESYSILKDKYPQLEISNQICNATFNRQKAAVRASRNVDLAIVVGDKSSNNANTLAKTIEESCHVKTILIESKDDLIGIDFKNIKKVSLTSAASTPKIIVTEVENFLLNEDTKKDINFLEYLKI